MARSLRGCFALLLLLAGCSEGGAPSVARLGSAEDPIVGGDLDTTTKAVVALTDDYGGTQLGFCTGSLIASNLVLTARHCVAVIENEVDGGVVCGTTTFGALYPYDALHVSVQDDITDGADPSQLYGVQAIRTVSGSSVCDTDLALLILEGTGIPESVAKPFTPRLDSPPDEGDAFTATGYGIQAWNDSNGVTFGERRRFDGATVFCGEDCPEPAEPREWVANAPTCSGDSGGPAVDGSSRVMGALSRGDEQCSYAIYSGTLGHAELIRQTALEAAALAGSDPPPWVDGSEVDAGSPPDAGGVDSGTVDSGMDEEDAGTAPPRPMPGSDAGVDPTPTVDPLGSTCEGACPGNYACFSETGEPPGICVPRCAAHLPPCPSGYECSARLAACVPEQGDQDDDDDGGGCSVARPRAAEPLALPLVAVLGAALLRSRRRAALKAR